jgi:hypothetical protein
MFTGGIWFQRHFQRVPLKTAKLLLLAPESLLESFE